MWQLVIISKERIGGMHRTYNFLVSGNNIELKARIDHIPLKIYPIFSLLAMHCLKKWRIKHFVCAVISVNMVCLVWINSVFDNNVIGS